jgi:isochorismate pyruvate lyase
MKTPTVCDSLPDVRQAIDQIDEQIIALLGLRADYVRAAARFKTSEAAVAAPERQAAMFEVRRGWAEREKLDPGFIEKLYRDVVSYFVAREMEHWKAGATNHMGT